MYGIYTEGCLLKYKNRIHSVDQYSDLLWDLWWDFTSQHVSLEALRKFSPNREPHLSLHAGGQCEADRCRGRVKVCAVDQRPKLSPHRRQFVDSDNGPVLGQDQVNPQEAAPRPRLAEARRRRRKALPLRPSRVPKACSMCALRGRSCSPLRMASRFIEVEVHLGPEFGPTTGSGGAQSWP